MRIGVISQALAVVFILLTGVARGESKWNSEESFPELEPEAHTLFEKEDPIHIDPEAHGVYTLFDKEEDLGLQDRDRVLKTRRSLYQILRRNHKRKNSKKSSKSTRRKRSLYTILRNRARKKLLLSQKNAVKPGPADSVNAADRKQRNDQNTKEQEIGSAGRPTPKKNEVECKTISERNSETKGETKDEPLREPGKSTPDKSLDIPDNSQHGGRYRRSRL